MGCKPTEFAKKLTTNRDYLLVYIRDGSADCQPTGTGAYRIAENYRLLQEEVQKGALSRTLYVILSTKITPALREQSLPIQVEESVSSVQDEVIPVTWNGIISMVENNPTEFNARIQRAYDEEYASLEDSTVRQDAAVLNAVVEIICWTVSRTVQQMGRAGPKCLHFIVGVSHSLVGIFIRCFCTGSISRCSLCSSSKWVPLFSGNQRR